MIPRSSGLLRPFVLILPVNNSLTAGAIFKAGALLEVIVHLRWNIHITALADFVFDFGYGDSIAMFEQLVFKYF